MNYFCSKLFKPKNKLKNCGKMTGLSITMILVIVQEIMAFNDGSDITKLYERLPQPIHTLDIEEWVKWKAQMDKVINSVLPMLSESAMNFIRNAEIHEPLLQNSILAVNESLIEHFSVPSSLLTKKDQFKKSVLYYYALALKLMAVHETFTLEKIPVIEDLPDTSGSTIVKWASNVYDLLTKISQQLLYLHDERRAWPVFELFYDCKAAKEEIGKYKDYWPTAVDSYLALKPSVKESVKKYGKLLPQVYTKCMILLRYYKYTEHFEFTEIKERKVESMIHEQLVQKGEDNFELFIIIAIYIVIALLFLFYNFYRIFLSR